MVCRTPTGLHFRCRRQDEHSLFKATPFPLSNQIEVAMTYHGPGQLIMYPLLNLKRLRIDVKQLVCKLEKTIIECLKCYQIDKSETRRAGRLCGAEQDRIHWLTCSQILQLPRDRSNVNMSLKLFLAINPCGYEGLKNAK